MPQLLRMFVPVLLALALLAIAGAAAAHVAAEPAVPPEAVETVDADAIVPILIAGPAAPAPPWYLPAALALLALATWRRPRRTLGVALVLLLCVFAFENALHSVHHGFDPQQQAECTVAAASAHLAAVPVDGMAVSSVVLPVSGEADPARSALAPSRFLSPEQGRAPPATIL